MLLFELIIKDVKVLFKYKNLIALSIIFPLIVFLILGFMFSDIMNINKTVDKIDIAIVNKDNSEASNLLVNNFKENKSFTKLFDISDYSEDEANLKFDDGNLISVVQIPEGFSDSLLHFENNEIKVTLNQLSPFKSLIFKNIMNSYKKYVSSTDVAVYSLYEQIKDIGISKEKIEKTNDIFSLEMIFTALGRDKLFDFSPIITIPSTSSIEYFVIAIGVMFIMFTGLIGMNFMVYERNTMCFIRYKTSSSSIALFVLSKLIVLFTYSIIQILIFIIPITIILKLNFSFSIFNLIIFIALSILSILSLAIFTGCFIKNEEISTLVGNIGIFSFALIGGSFIPLQLMPIKIQYISMVTPNYWIIKGLLYIIKGFELKYIYSNISVLILSSFVLIFASTLKLSKSR